jgi:mannosyltransferase
VHPPLWYLLCWPLAHIPGLPAWAVVRIPSILAGIAAIWIWWLILQVMAPSPRVRLVAFGLFCILPQQIYYAQEGRMYALLTLLVLSAWLCILRRRWAWLAVATALMLWLQNYGLFYALALWLAALVYDRRIWRPLTVALAIAGLSYIPWMFIMVRQMSEINGNYWMLRVTLPSVLGDLVHTFFGTVLLSAEIVNFTVFYGVLTWVLIWSLRRRTLSLPAVILAFLPLTLAALISFLWQPIMLYRALIPSGAFIALILVEPVAELKLRPLLLMAIFFIPALVVNLASTELRSHWANDILYKNGEIIAMIDSQWQEGDLLYYADDGVFVTGAVYWQHIDNAIRIAPCGIVLGGLSPQTRAALGMQVGPFPEHVVGRIWVINALTPLIPQCENDYLIKHGLLDTVPLDCSENDELVQSCVYLVEP